MRILTFICLVGVVLAIRSTHRHHHKQVDPMVVAGELEAEAGGTIVDPDTVAWIVNYAEDMSYMCGCEDFHNGREGVQD